MFLTSPRRWFRKSPRTVRSNRRHHVRLLSAGGLPRLEDRVQPATFTVTTLADDGAGSLREAMTKANAAAGADVIDLTGVTGTISLFSTLPSVSDSLAINGPGASKLTINASSTSGRIFTLCGTTSLSGMTLTGGNVTDDGGAIFMYGRCTVSDCVISGNLTTTTSNYQGGGGIFVGDDSHLTLLNSVVTGNSSGAVGGAIFGAFRSIVEIRYCAITNNVAAGNGFGAGGGGIYFGNQGTLLAANTTISGNTSSGSGAGIYFYGTNPAGSSASWVLAQSTISNNTSTAGSGGGIRVQSDNQLVLLESTISGNSAVGNGGGVSVIYGGTIFMQSTIVAGNFASTANDISDANTVTATNSAFSDTTGFTITPASSTNKIDTFANLLLGPLQDNGGRLLPDGNKMQSRLPLSGSPLIDAGVNVFTQGLDGRGYPRTTGASVDIGAGEFGTEALAGTNSSLTLSYVSSGAPSFQLKVTYTDDAGVKLSSIDATDLTITGPSPIMVTGVTVDKGSDSPVLVATYTITPTDNSWDSADIGTYVVKVVAGQVTDTSLNLISGGTATKFNATPPPQVFTVTTNADSGAGSLRDALTKANASTGTHDTIAFGAGTGALVITPTSALPSITDEVTIDGKTQPGYVNNPIVQLVGSSAGAQTTGLIVLAGNSTIRGLNVRSFGFAGVLIRGGDGNTVQNCFIGTTAAGTGAAANGARGIFIQDSSSNLIGGPNTQDRNVVSGNTDQGICVLAGGNNVIQNNYIGLNVSGTAAVPNTGDGMFFGRGSSYNLLVGNVSSGNGNHGMEIYDFGSTHNRIQGNKFGTTANGNFSLKNGNDGVVIGVGASDNFVGTDGDGVNDANEGNLLSGNGRFGVYLYDGSSRNTVAGNTIGTDPSGQFSLGNGSDGIRIETFAGQPTTIGNLESATDNVIGTNGDGVSDDLEGNLISGNGNHGVTFLGFGINYSRISGNIIGTTRDGLNKLGNKYDAVAIHYGASHTIIGTNSDGKSDNYEGNVLSGNGRYGVLLYFGTTDNRVAGNRIGTDITGTVAIGNNNDGVHIESSDTTNPNRQNFDNIIGTNGDGIGDDHEGNVISGNGGYGVQISGAGSAGNRVAGNIIGLNAAGDAAVPNLFEGLVMHFGTTNNIIGTNGDGVSDAAERNIISGSPSWGVVIARGGTDGNVVAGNYIGTDITGTVALGNGRSGVWIFLGATNNRIGTNADGVSDALEGNLISGNGFAFPVESRPGITIADGGTTGNIVAGNRIGTDVTGTLPLGNFRNGIDIYNGASNNTIGMTIGGPSASANIIAFNGKSAISIKDATTASNLVLGNRIFKNTSIGIDLGDDGPTANDPLDADTGPNTLLNFPDLTSAMNGAATTVSGSYSGAANTTVTLAFYANSSGAQGERFLGTTDVTTDGLGTVTFTNVMIAGASAAGESITAMAIDGAGNSSEFSNAVQIPGPPAKIAAGGIVINVGAAQRSRVTVVDVSFDQIVDFAGGNGNAAAAFQLFRQSDNATVTLNAAVDNTGPGTKVTLTFTGGAVDGGTIKSLQDGRFTLTALSANISNGNGALDGDGNGTAGGDYVLASASAPSSPNNIFRRYGDIDGSGVVDGNDFLQFRLAFLQNVDAFDYDGSGSVDGPDFLQFRLRFLSPLP